MKPINGNSDLRSEASLLQGINSPQDVKNLSQPELAVLADEIRQFLIEKVCRTGGHLGPNLGVVELTIALHRVFDSPQDRFLFDTGHQAYVHKMLTGRQAGFDTLRQEGGLSGYPSQEESEHDIIENSHASTALGYADGLAKAFELQKITDRRIAVVVGDGSLTGGMAWEALNNIAMGKQRPMVIVVNDNERSYSPTVGGLSVHLTNLRFNQAYERFLAWGKKTLNGDSGGNHPVYKVMHALKAGFKDIFTPQTLFEDLGLKYLGPIDGHDIQAVEHALTLASKFDEPVIVHCITHKGQGYEYAEGDEADHFHGIGVIDPYTGEAFSPPAASWTNVFSDEIVRIADDRPEVVGITAAMLRPVGLYELAQKYPDRVFDVGIAEQHAVVSAAGLALGGLHPVVAVYATFLNRAFDQVLMDVALHKYGVTFVLDRAGVTGDDGASHNGMWDMSILQAVPGLRIAAPRDAQTLRDELREAVAVTDAPTVVRFPKSSVGADIPALDRVEGMDILAQGDAEDEVLIVSIGALAQQCLDAASQLKDLGVGVTVVDPRWVKPINPALTQLASQYRVVVTVEDNGRVGGVGATLAQACRDAEIDTWLIDLGIPQEFLNHAKRADILAEIGLNPSHITDVVRKALKQLDESSFGQVDTMVGSARGRRQSS